MYAADETIGHPVTKLIPRDRQDEEPKILERLRRGERGEQFETIRVRKNGEQFPISLISGDRVARIADTVERHHWMEVLETGGTPEEIRNGLDVTKRNALMQAQLIEDMLDFGRISSGKMRSISPPWI